MNTDTDVETEWDKSVKICARRSLETIISEEGLKPEQTKKFIANAFLDGVLKTSGADFYNILPPTPMFSKTGDSIRKRNGVREKLMRFFEKFSGLCGRIFFPI